MFYPSIIIVAGRLILLFCQGFDYISTGSLPFLVLHKNEFFIYDCLQRTSIFRRRLTVCVIRYRFVEKKLLTIRIFIIHALSLKGRVECVIAFIIINRNVMFRNITTYIILLVRLERQTTDIINSLPLSISQNYILLCCSLSNKTVSTLLFISFN